MLSARRAVVGYLIVLVALLAVVLLLTDRGGFAWALAGAVFVGVVGGDVAVRAIRTRSAKG